MLNKYTRSSYNDKIEIETARQISKKHDYFCQEAVKLATKSTMHQKHGCVIIQNNNIIGRGFNYYAKFMEHKYSIHAEVSAINDAKKNKIAIENAIMYVVRIKNSDIHNNYDLIETKQSQPCTDCLKCIQNYKINKVFFSIN